MPKQYPKDLRDRAVRLVREHRGDYGTEWEAIGSIAKKLGIGSAETLRKWVLCRGRHKIHYADLRIMPTRSGACGWMSVVGNGLTLSAFVVWSA